MRKILYTTLITILMLSGCYFSCSNQNISFENDIEDTEKTFDGNEYTFYINLENSPARTINPDITFDYFDTITLECSGPGTNGEIKNLTFSITSSNRTVTIEGNNTWTFKLTCVKGETVFISKTKTVSLNTLGLLYQSNKKYISFTLEKQSFVLSNEGTGTLKLSFNKKEKEQEFYSRAVRISLLDVETELPLEGYNNIWLDNIEDRSYTTIPRYEKTDIPCGSYLLVYQLCNASDNTDKIYHVADPVILEEYYEVVNIDKNAVSQKEYILDLQDPEKSIRAGKSPDFEFYKKEGREWSYFSLDQITKLEGATAIVTYTYKDEFGSTVSTDCEVPLPNDTEYTVAETVPVNLYLPKTESNRNYYSNEEYFRVNCPIKFRELTNVIDVFYTEGGLSAKFSGINKDGSESFAIGVLDESEYTYELIKYNPKYTIKKLICKNFSKEVTFNNNRTNNYYTLFEIPYELTSGKDYVEDVEDRNIRVEDFPKVSLPEDLEDRYTFLGWRIMDSSLKTRDKLKGWIYFSNCESGSKIENPVIVSDYKLSELSTCKLYPVWITNNYVTFKSVSDQAGNMYGDVYVPYGKRVLDCFPQLSADDKTFLGWRSVLSKPYIVKTYDNSIHKLELTSNLYNITFWKRYREIKYNTTDKNIYVHIHDQESGPDHEWTEAGPKHDLTVQLYDGIESLATGYDSEKESKIINLIGRIYMDDLTYELNSSQCQCKDFWIYDDFVEVEGGVYTDTEGEKHNISTFKIGKTELTEATYYAINCFMWNENPTVDYANSPHENLRVYADHEFTSKEYKTAYIGTTSEFFKMFLLLNEISPGKFSVPGVNEFHWAASGGKNGKDTIYAGSNTLSSVHWKNDSLVAQAAPNELGLYDMTGHLWEYTGTAVTLPYEYTKDDVRYTTTRVYAVLVGGADEVGKVRNAFSYGAITCGARLMMK